MTIMGSINDFDFPFYVKKIDAAFTYGPLKNTYFFTDDLYWRYNEVKCKMDHGYPRKIAAVWKGLPSKIDSAFTWLDGRTYFFKGKSKQAAAVWEYTFVSIGNLLYLKLS